MKWPRSASVGHVLATASYARTPRILWLLLSVITYCAPLLLGSMAEITIALLATADDLGYAAVRDEGIVSCACACFLTR